jgi:hypothetical protein
MNTRKWNPAAFVLWLSTLLFLLPQCLFAQQSPPPPPGSASSGLPPQDFEREIFKVCEEMPAFPGCSHLSNFAERSACSDQKLMQYLKTQIQYRPEKWLRKTNYTASAAFLVDPHGVISEIVLRQAPDTAAGEELLRVLRLMAQNEQWTPGRQRGRPVWVMYPLLVDLRQLLRKK